VSPTIRFGIEEEFFLSDLDSGDIVRRPPAGFVRDCRRALGDRLSSELLQCQLETKTPIVSSRDEARLHLTTSRGELARTGERYGIGLMASGTHPLAQWRDQLGNRAPRYRQLFDDFRIIAERNLLCGLHVHAEVPATVDRVLLMNQVMRWLPMLLALSASSPFWARRDTGMMSYRQSAYDEWPRTGIPRLFRDEAEYRRYAGLLIAARAIPDESHIWWAIRPSVRYPTLELRIADACPVMDDALCIAELFRTVVHRQIGAILAGETRGSDGIERLLIEEDRWQAKRFGVAAQFINPANAEALDMTATLERFEVACGPALGELDAAWALDHARTIVRQGSSAHRQRSVYTAARERGAAARGALREVVDSLIAETRH
jgi:carboxylate-amine ligase